MSNVVPIGGDKRDLKKDIMEIVEKLKVINLTEDSRVSIVKCYTEVYAAEHASNEVFVSSV